MSRTALDWEEMRRRALGIVLAPMAVVERTVTPTEVEEVGGEYKLRDGSGKYHLKVGESSICWGGREIQVEAADPKERKVRALEPRDLKRLPKDLSKPSTIVYPLEEGGKTFHDAFGNAFVVPHGFLMVVNNDYPLFDVPSRENRDAQPYLRIDLESTLCRAGG